MKLLLIEFLLYFLTNFIQEDFSDLNLVGKIFVYPAWVIRCIIMWMISPIFVIPFLIKISDFYKQYKKMSNELMIEFMSMTDKK